MLARIGCMEVHNSVLQYKLDLDLFRKRYIEMCVDFAASSEAEQSNFARSAKAAGAVASCIDIVYRQCLPRLSCDFQHSAVNLKFFEIFGSLTKGRFPTLLPVGRFEYNFSCELPTPSAASLPSFIDFGEVEILSREKRKLRRRGSLRSSSSALRRCVWRGAARN